jgi:hypothetical protein
MFAEEVTGTKRQFETYAAISTLPVQPTHEADYGDRVILRVGASLGRLVLGIGGLLVWATHSSTAVAQQPGLAEFASATAPLPLPREQAAPLNVRPTRGTSRSTTSGTSKESVRYVVDSIIVTGNTLTRDTVIVRFVPFTPGDILDVDDPRLELTKFRLLGTGFFRDATLSLQKGRLPGHVSLVVNVVERNTIVVNDVWMGLAASADTSGGQSDISSFAGIDAAETNLLGTGITLGLAAAFSADQKGLALRYHDPAFLGGRCALGRPQPNRSGTTPGRRAISTSRSDGGARPGSWRCDAGLAPLARRTVTRNVAASSVPRLRR